MAKCRHCGKEVKKKDHQVVLSTLNRPNNNKDDHKYFHFQCFVSFWNEGVNKKVRSEVEKMRVMAFGILENPMIRGVIDKVGGGEQLQEVLGKSLIKDPVVQVVNKQEVKKKIDNERKKRERKTKKRSD